MAITDAGFHINPQHPFFGASPDANVSCKSCGLGIVKAKCPHKCTVKEIDSLVLTKGFCLEKLNDKFCLKRDNAYYYQVQAELAASGRFYCDFVVWSETAINIEQIFPDKTFICHNLKKATAFFKSCVLLELVGKWFTAADNERPSIVATSNLSCFCREPEATNMIECSSTNCSLKKFHLNRLHGFGETAQH